MRLRPAWPFPQRQPPGLPADSHAIRPRGRHGNGAGIGPLRYFAVGLIALFAGALASEALATATVNKQFTPATADPGETSRFRISFFNSSLVPLTAAAVTDNLLAQVTIAAVPNIVDTCGFGTVVAAGGTSTIRASGGTIPAGSGITDGFCYFEVDVVSIVPGNWQNTIPANGPTNGFTPDGATAGFQATEVASVVTNTTPAVATLSIKSLTNPTGAKTFAPSPALAGEPITLSIVLTNANAGSTIPLTTFTDTLPAGMVVAPTPLPTIVCTGTGAANGVVTANPGDPGITLTGGTIGMAGACTVTVRVVANTVTGTSQVFANVVPANAIGNTRGLSSATFNRSVTINSPITLAKSFVATVGGTALGATPIVAGQEVYVRIDIGNASTVNPLTITSFTDPLPTGLVVGSTLPVVIDCTTNGGGTNGTVTAVPGSTSFTVANAVVGITGGTRRCRISVPVVASASGTYLNSIPANAVTNPANLGSPVASATLNVNSQLTVEKTVSPANAAPGQPVTFTVTIRNFSTGPVTGVQFTDTLPLVGGDQMVISNPNNFLASAGCSGGTFSNTPGASSLSWTGGTITGGIGAAPGVCTIRFNANTPIGTPLGATFTNAIAAGGITGDGGITNPGGTSVNVVMIAAASVSKAFLPTTVVQGGTSVLTVTLSNQTATPLTNSSLTDTLPAGVIVSATPGTTTTCANGVVTAAALGNTASIAGATIPANGNCNFRVNVVGTLVGTRTNTIPALALANDQNAQNPSPASANLVVTSGLTATKQFTPTSVANGGVSRVTVRVTNPSVTPLTGVAITDGPMLNLVVANPADASTTCAGSPVIVATPGSNTVTLTGASVAAGGNCDLLFNVLTSNNPTNWPNTIPIGNITSNEGASNTAAVSATLGKVTTISIGINKSFNPVSVSGSQPSVLQIDLTNPVGSPSAVNNLSFTDNLPNGMEVHAVPNISTTCTNGTVTAVPGTSTITLTGATLPAASTCSVFVNVTSIRFLNLVNTIPIGAVTTTQGITNSLATTATLSTLQGLGVMKSFNPTSASVGQPVLMDIRVLSTLNPTALPPVTLHNVSFTDTLPPGMTVANPPNASTTCVNGSVNAVAGASTVTVTGADINPEANCHVYVDVVADSLGAFTNTIPIGAVTSTEGYQNPNPASATLNVVTSPPLSKAFSPNPVLPGQSSVLTITIGNPNALVLTNVALTDTLPPGLVTSTTPNPLTTCTGGAVSALASGNTIALTNGTIGGNGSCTITVNVLSNTPNGYTNTIPVGALTTAQGVSNVDPASSTLIVLGPPGVSKSFTPTTIGVNMTSQLTLTLSNGNAVAGTLTAPLVDTLPGGLVIANPPNLSGTCTLASVTATANSGTITYASGAALPVAGCTIVVDVTSPTPGTYVNTIPAGGLVTDAGTNAAPATATLIVNTPPTLAKTMLPATIALGGSSTLTLTLGNGNAGAITLTSAFNDPMPAGVATTGVVTNTCGAVVTANAVTVPSGTSIPAGGCTIVVTITSSTPGAVVNQTDPLSTTTGTAPAAQAPLTVTALAPTLAKSIAPSTIAAGGPATLTLTLGNPNAVPITLSAQFTDPMPAGVSITGPNSGTCGGVTVTENSVAVAAGTAIPVGVCTIVVAITSSTPGTVTNTTGTLTTNAGDAPAASADLTVSAPPTLAKSIAPASIGIGGTSTLTLTLGNGNPTSITLTSAFGDTMPAGVSTTGVVTNTCGAVVTSGAITVASGTVIPAGGCVIVVTITSSTPGTVTNVTDPLVTSTGTAPSAQAPLLVTIISSALTKSILPSTITAGGASTLTIALANPNVAPLVLTAAFIDAMPAGVTTTGASTGTCPGVTVTATSITMASGSAIAPGGCTIVVPITSFTPGTVTNTTGTLQTTGGTTTPASAPLAVTASIPTLTKTIVPGTIAVGGSATLTITLGNINTTPVTLTASFFDPMPSGVTTTGANTGTCPGVAINPSVDRDGQRVGDTCGRLHDRRDDHVVDARDGHQYNELAADECRPDTAGQCAAHRGPGYGTDARQDHRARDHRRRRHGHADDHAGQSGARPADADVRLHRHDAGGGHHDERQHRHVRRRHRHADDDHDGERLDAAGRAAARSS